MIFVESNGVMKGSAFLEEVPRAIPGVGHGGWREGGADGNFVGEPFDSVVILESDRRTIDQCEVVPTPFPCGFCGTKPKGVSVPWDLIVLVDR